MINQEKYYNAPTYEMPRASVVADMTKLALTTVGESFKTTFQLGFNDSRSDQAARISFKVRDICMVFTTNFTSIFAVGSVRFTDRLFIR